MIAPLARQRICRSCSSQLLLLFTHGFSSKPTLRRLGGKLSCHNRHRGTFQLPSRNFTSGKAYTASVEHEEINEVQIPRTVEHMEAIARQARQTFGDTLPQDFLLPEEYTIYERLYGPPSAIMLPEDVDLLQGVVPQDGDSHENVLMRENADGELEDITYEAATLEEPEDVDNIAEVDFQTQEDFRARMAILRDIAAAKSTDLVQEAAALTGEKPDASEVQEESVLFEDQDHNNTDTELYEEEAQANGLYGFGDSERTHPLTTAGRFGTSPGTIQVSKGSVVDQVTDLLSNASNKHLAEVALKIFGGPGLPNSTATITRPNLRQQPIALEAKQAFMGEMEGNAYMAAVMPGAYATVMSTLVEVRKRLGSAWLQDLMRREGGPRILDAGSGGAGVLAWREILRAEWELMHPAGVHHDQDIPYGKSTVVTGSATLRHRASQLLDNTTFIPRLPDYDPSRDHPSLQFSNPQPRKQYDIILAPHTLWSLKEDHMRKSQVQNYWSLLDSNGGILVLVEKGVPRGFELIAGARETLLKHHIASPDAVEVESHIEDASQNRFGPKEKGMIIAPCTNHGKCPMYITAGTSHARKDFCHFSQRYLRPPYLQRILGYRDRNHEDLKFSYVALQRGVDQRENRSIVQGIRATEAAFEGYEEKNLGSESAEDQTRDPEPDLLHVNTLSLPRAILPPIKRRGHVTLDLCTPAGRIERWTVPRSFSKQAYRDARKSKWGDLWALGAKTRVQRNIRVGFKKEESQTRNTSGTADNVHGNGKKPRAAMSKIRNLPMEEKPQRKKLHNDY